MATQSPQAATYLSSNTTSEHGGNISLLLRASEFGAAVDNRQRRPYELLAALRCQTERIPIDLPPSGNWGRSPTTGPASTRLENCRAFFETHLQKILSHHHLDDDNMELSSPDTARLLRDNLGELCNLLNDVANDVEFTDSLGGTQASHVPLHAAAQYARLEKVLLKAEQSSGPLQLATGSTTSLFRLDTIAIARGAHSIVKQISRSLSKLRNGDSHYSAEFTAFEYQKRNEVSHAPSWLQTFDRSYRAHLGGILDAMHADFSKCAAPDADEKTHQILLRLFDLESLNQPVPKHGLKPELLLYCPKSRSWQNTICHAHSRDWFEPATLCRLVAESLRRGDGLVLSFSEAHQAFTRNKDTLDPLDKSPHGYPRLTGLINVCCAFNPSISREERHRVFTYSERRTLATQLALHLLLSSNWHHSSRPWDSDEVYFSGSSLWDYKKAEAYISCFIQPSTDSHADANDEGPIPSFTRFARLLLELEYGPLSPGDFGPKNDYGYKLIKEFYQSKRDFGDLSRESYLKAVDTCLQFDRLLRLERSKAMGRQQPVEDTCRRLIRNKIVANIMQDLQPPARASAKRRRQSQPHSTEDDESHASDSDNNIKPQDRRRFDTHIAVPRPLRPQKRPRSTGHSGASSLIAQNLCLSPKETVAELGPRTRTTIKQPDIGNTPMENWTRHQSVPITPRIDSITNTTTLFDAVTLSTPSETTTSAARWFEILEEKVHPILDRRRRTGNKPVKVAVLDTGIDASHKKIQYHLAKHGSTIMGCEDWTESQHGVKDNVGHGTAVCDVLLRTAKVHLFVGKISDEAVFDENVPARIAHAISHAAAADGWNVDIIVLSLGFESEDRAIRNAIRDAFNEDKVILAAASNSGSIDLTKRVSFPARIPGQVISMRSATGFGQRAKTSPRRSDGDDNFAILGEGVETAWPEHLNGGHLTRFVSGTSFATPLAAGIAALVMEFSIQEGRKGPNVKQHLDILWSYRGIRKMFEYMSTIQDDSVNVDCRVIAPWRLFDPDMEYEGFAHVIKHQLKSAS